MPVTISDWDEDQPEPTKFRITETKPGKGRYWISPTSFTVDEIDQIIATLTNFKGRQ